MAFQSQEMMEYISPNKSHTSRSFPHFQENISKSHSPNANIFSGQKPDSVSSIDFECSLFMDETSADLDNYLNTTLPECSKSFNGDDNSLNEQDFECKTMNNLSRNIKGRYQKNVRGLKKNNKFFKSQVTSNGDLLNPNEIPVIDEAMKKIFRPLVDKPDIKCSPKTSVKTYSNKHKKDRDIQIIESFGLPDEPLVPLVVSCPMEQDPVNLDVDKESLNNTLLSDPWAIHDQTDPTITIVDDFRRRSFSLFEDIAPFVGDSLEDEVKEGFNFEETTEVETGVIPERQEMPIQDLSDRNVREPKIFLEPLNLDDYQVFRANNLSPITNKKRLLFQRLRNYSRNIETSQIGMFKDQSSVEVKSINKEQKSALPKNARLDRNGLDRNDDMFGDPEAVNETLSNRINSRRSARLQNALNEKSSDDQVNNLNIILGAFPVELRLKTISDGASILKDKIKVGNIHSSIKPHRPNELICEGVVIEESTVRVKEFNSGTNKKTLETKQNSYMETTSPIDGLLFSPKRITRQSSHELVIGKLLNTSLESLVRHANGNEEKTKNTVEYNATKFYINKLKNNVEGETDKLSCCNSYDEKDVFFTKTEEPNVMKKKQTNISENAASASITLSSNSRRKSAIRSPEYDNDRNRVVLSNEEQIISPERLRNDKTNNRNLKSEPLSQLRKNILRRSTRGMQNNSKDTDCGEKGVENIHCSESNCMENCGEISIHAKTKKSLNVDTDKSKYSLHNNSREAESSKEKPKNWNKIQSTLETTERTGRISDRLRSKSAQRFSSSEKISVNELLASESVYPDILSENSESVLGNSYTKKNNGLKLEIMKIDEMTKSCYEVGSTGKLKKCDILKSPSLKKNQLKKDHESSKIESNNIVSSYRQKSEILNYSKSATLNKNGKLTSNKGNSKSLDCLQSLVRIKNIPNKILKLQSSEQLIFTKSPATGKNHKKISEKLCKPSGQESSKLTHNPKDKPKVQQCLKIPASYKNPQKKLNKICGPNEKCSETVPVLKKKEKMQKKMKTLNIYKNHPEKRDKISAPPDVVLVSKDEHVRPTRLKSSTPQHNDQKPGDEIIVSSNEQSIIRVMFPKNKQKISNCLKLAVTSNTPRKRGDKLAESSERGSTVIDKQKKQNRSKSLEKNQLKNDDKVCSSFDKDSNETKLSFEDKQMEQIRSESTGTKTIQKKKNEKIIEPFQEETTKLVLGSENKQKTVSKIALTTNIQQKQVFSASEDESAEKTIVFENKQMMVDRGKSQSPENKCGEIGESSGKGSSVVNENIQKSPKCSKSPRVDKNQPKKNLKELNEPLEKEPSKTIVGLKVKENTRVPDQIYLKEMEHSREPFAEIFSEKVFSSNDKSLTEERSKSTLPAVEVNSEDINSPRKLETLDFSKQQTKEQQKGNDEFGKSSTEEFIKNKSTSPYDLKSLAYDQNGPKMCDKLHEQSTEDITQDKTETEQHLISLPLHKNEHIRSDKINEVAEDNSTEVILTSINEISHINSSKRNNHEKIDEIHIDQIFTSEQNLITKKIPNTVHIHKDQQNEQDACIEPQEEESPEEMLSNLLSSNKTAIKRQMKSKQGELCVQQNEEQLVCGSNRVFLEELGEFKSLNNSKTHSKSENYNEIKDYHCSKVLSDIEQSSNKKNVEEVLDDDVTSPTNCDVAKYSTSIEEKSDQRGDEERMRTKSEQTEDLNIKIVDKLSFTRNSTATVNFYKTEKNEVNDKDFKIHGIEGEALLTSVGLKKDDNAVKGQLRIYDDSVNKTDIIPDNLFRKRTENLKNSPPIPNDKSTEVNNYSDKEKVVESDNPMKKSKVLDEYLDVGYDIHRRTSFRKILERVMEMSRIEMEMNQKESYRLQRCKSVPHEKFNSAKEMCTPPTSSSVDNKFKYLESDKNPIMKSINFSKVKKRLDYLTDSNISNLKQTKRSRTKSLHVTKSSIESEMRQLPDCKTEIHEIHNINNIVENECKVKEEALNKKRKRRYTSESDKINEENAGNVDMPSYLKLRTMRVKLTDVQYNPISKLKNLHGVDDGNLNVKEITKRRISQKVDEIDHLKLSPAVKTSASIISDEIDLEVRDANLECTDSEKSFVRKRSRSYSEGASKLGDETDSSVRRCKSAIGRAKKMSKRDSRRLKRILQLDKVDDDESKEPNWLETRVYSKAAKKVLYEFKVGDSIWGKVGNYPYWPCVIVLDPETSEFKKYKLLRTTPYYHVRFFGDNGKRAWTTHVIPYEGPDDLDKLARKFWREGVQTSYIKECYCIKPTQCDKWKTAVSEAETMKNESAEYKMNFFKEMFGEENNVCEDGEASESSSIKTQPDASTSRVKKSKKGKIIEEDGNKSSAHQNKRVPMREASVLSCINDVITKYCTSGEDDNSGHDSNSVGRDLTRRKRKRKKKVTGKVKPQDFHADLGLDLLNLPPAKAKNSLNTASESNDTGSTEDALFREKGAFFSSANFSSLSRSKRKNQKNLKIKNDQAVSNHSLSDIDSTTKLKSSSYESIRRRSRSLSRIDKCRVREDSCAISEFCTPSTEPVASSISNLIFSPPKLRDRKLAISADQSDSESRASDNSFVNSNVSQLSQHKKNLFRGVTKDKICQICEKPVDVVKCKGPCNGDYHVKCVENSLKITEKQVADQHKNESIVCDRDDKNQQVQIITVSSRKKLPDNLTLSPRNRETSLTEVQIDRKMKEIMNQIESNGSYNAEFMESTDSGGDEVNFDDKSKLESSNTKTASSRNSVIPQKPKGIFKHVTADDISIISITEDGTVNRRSVPHEIVEHKETASVDDSTYKCPYCISSVVPPCFVCNSIISKKGSTMRQRCSLQKCGRFFHLECLNTWPQTQWSFILHEKRKSEALDSFVCPRHVCHICASENLGSSIGRCPNDKLVKCLRCPATYHNSYHCVPAGSQLLTSTQIICPRHVREKAKRPVTCNTIWCFVCSEGGNLICCETCPTSVHVECLPVNLMDDDTYICEDCESGRFPLYDEVVWVKCGAFRWWPAIILFPSEVPANVEAKPHSEGDFVVKFFGTYDYYWVGRGRTFLYQEGDTGYLNSNKNRIDEAFSRALKEAADVYRLKIESKSKRETEVNNGLKPPSYVRIKVNRPVGNVRVFEGNLSNTTSCECDPKDLNPCGPNSNCLNRILLTECNPEVCPAGRKCNNQSFEKRDYPQMVPYRTGGRGWGLKTLECLQKGQFIIEYVGEIIDDEEYQRRIKRMHQQKDENYYFLTIDNNRMLDAGPKGNAARFMNHSCQPNCETQKWTVNGDTRVGLFAIEDIAAETELTFNYNLECAGTEKKICRCGAPNCSGYIGVKPDDQKPPRRIRKEKKKETQNQEKVVNESACFVCGKNGDVGICTNKLCLKSYHLKCVQLDSWPDSKWTCPSHNCNICSRRTIRSCVQCTNSYCPVHSEGKVRHDSQLGFVCRQHDPTKRKRGRPRKDSINKSATPQKSKKTFNGKEGERSSSRLKEYPKIRNLENEKEPSPKKMKLAN